MEKVTYAKSAWSHSSLVMCYPPPHWEDEPADHLQHHPHHYRSDRRLFAKRSTSLLHCRLDTGHTDSGDVYIRHLVLLVYARAWTI